MNNAMRMYWPEILIGVFGVFFVFRDLGTFPTHWLDDSLFMVVARNLAEGGGYALPVLSDSWPFSYLLGVGPTVILPAALMAKLFGFSVAVVRIPFALMTLLSVVCTYIFVKQFSTKQDARWVAALLVSFSAFVNTGKPVLGEIPGFLFFVLGLLLWVQYSTRKSTVLSGVFFGFAVISKVTYGIIFPAFGLAWLCAFFLGRRTELVRLTMIGGIAALLFSAWYGLQMYFAPGSLAEIRHYGLADGGSALFAVLRDQPQLLLRFPYLYFGALLVFFCAGIYTLRASFSLEMRIFILSFILLVIAFFLNGPGWYRHLLLAHLLVILFVPAGVYVFFKNKIAVVLLLFFILAQGWWQLTNRGSTKTDEEILAAARLLELYPSTRMVIQEPQIYILLPRAEHRMFLSVELSNREFSIFDGLPLKQSEHCLPLVLKIGEAERAELGERVHTLDRRYVLVDPPASCQTK